LLIYIANIEALDRKMQYHYLKILILQGRQLFWWFISAETQRLNQLDIVYNTDYLIQWIN